MPKKMRKKKKKKKKKSWKTQEEEILISDWRKYEYLYNTKSDDYKLKQRQKENGFGSYFKRYQGGHGNFVHR